MSTGRIAFTADICEGAIHAAKIGARAASTSYCEGSVNALRRAPRELRHPRIHPCREPARHRPAPRKADAGALDATYEIRCVPLKPARHRRSRRGEARRTTARRFRRARRRTANYRHACRELLPARMRYRECCERLTCRHENSRTKSSPPPSSDSRNRSGASPVRLPNSGRCYPVANLPPRRDRPPGSARFPLLHAGRWRWRKKQGGPKSGANLNRLHPNRQSRSAGSAKKAWQGSSLLRRNVGP